MKPCVHHPGRPATFYRSKGQRVGLCDACAARVVASEDRRHARSLPVPIGVLFTGNPETDAELGADS